MILIRSLEEEEIPGNNFLKTMSSEVSKYRSHAELVSASPETLKRVQGDNKPSGRVESRHLYK